MVWWMDGVLPPFRAASSGISASPMPLWFCSQRPSREQKGGPSASVRLAADKKKENIIETQVVRLKNWAITINQPLCHRQCLLISVPLELGVEGQQTTSKPTRQR